METHSRRSVLIVVPVFALVYPKAFKNFLGLALAAAHTCGDRYRFDVHVPERELLHSAMNNAVEGMLKGEYDAMIVCDDDCFPPMHAIPELLKHFENGFDIVAGLGYMRGFPHTTTAGKYYPEGVSIVSNEKDGTTELTGFQWLDDLPVDQGLQEVDFCGFPIAMISRRAFEKLPAPWFGTELDGGAVTHDVYFAHHAKRAGLTLYVDTNLPCGHLTEAPIVTHQNRVFSRRVRKLLASGGKVA